MRVAIDQQHRLVEILSKGGDLCDEWFVVGDVSQRRSRAIEIPPVGLLGNDNALKSKVAMTVCLQGRRGLGLGRVLLFQLDENRLDVVKRFVGMRNGRAQQRLAGFELNDLGAAVG